MNQDIIMLDHGSGGLASKRLVDKLISEHLANPIIERMDDAALLENISGPLAMSTDGYTVTPIFFPGGNIGSLAVHGTLNDVAMLGAKPEYLSCAFILEEGLPVADLEKIVAAMGEAAKKASALIVCGDTKVVPRGCADKIFITTTGLGRVRTANPPAGAKARPGDAVLLSGTIGDHGLTIMACRNELHLEVPVQSDSADVSGLVLELIKEIEDIHVLRDPTRGGLATTLCEIAEQSKVGVELLETSLPIQKPVKSACEILGLEPLYLANEGKFICILPEKSAAKALRIMRGHPLGEAAVKVGRITGEHPGQVVLETEIGGRRLLTMLEGDPLPRIC